MPFYTQPFCIRFIVQEYIFTDAKNVYTVAAQLCSILHFSEVHCSRVIMYMVSMCCTYLLLRPNVDVRRHITKGMFFSLAQ